MPKNLKCVIAFGSAEGYGWTETHYWLSPSDSPNLLTRIENLQNVVCPARAALLGQGCDIRGIRVSYPVPGAIASRSARVFIDGPDDHGSSSQSASIAVNFVDGTNTRKKIVHLRGFWDAVEGNQIYTPDAPDAAGWNDRFIAWKDTLVGGGYGWLSKDPALTPSGQVTNYVQNIDNTITFTLLPVGATPLVVGSVYSMKFSKLNGSKSVLNRVLKVKATAVNTVITTNPIAAGPFTGIGTYSARATTFVAYSGTGSIDLGERRMGAPLNHYPGRSKARPRI